ncbi:MAG: hypothetical protein QOG43_149 [Actinomycetota bacterium]|nr:hypothetical protein [Actinomycetota bacterium]
MVDLEVRLISGPQEWGLGSSPRIVPAGQIVIAVSGSRTRTVTLDGRLRRLSSGKERLLAVDLKRSTGYHRLEVDGSTFWFATEDAKLGLEGIEVMLAQLRTIGTGWTGQALFSDGSGLRDVHVLYAWLDQWADEALAAVSGILAAPRPVSINNRALRRRGGPRVLVAPTVRLLRSSPRQYLHPNAAGLVEANGKRYDPLRVVVRRRTTTLDSIANRRAAGLLRWLARLIQEVLQSVPDTATQVRCRRWLNTTQTLQRRPVAQMLRSFDTGTAPRQAEETTDARYRKSYEVSHDLRRQFGWSANVTPLPRYSYVNHADNIYQAYAASCVAKALGLTQTSEVLGVESPAFSGPDFDLYVDTASPPAVLRSWRAASALPDASRPDLLLHERVTGRVAILDAKYRLFKAEATEESRKEVTSYLGLYGLHTITIIFPGDPGAARIISGKGRKIIELPLKPPDPQATITASLPAVLAGLELPPY